MARKQNKATIEETINRIVEYLPKSKRGSKTSSEIREACITTNVSIDEFYITGAEVGAAMKKLEKTGKIESEFKDLHDGKYYEGARYYWLTKEDKK